MSSTAMTGASPSAQNVFHKGRIFKAVLLGAPGSLKTELADTIAATFNLSHISVRERIDLNIVKESKFGLLAKGCIEKGVPISNNIMMKFISKQIMDTEMTNNSWVISGFPVTKSQAGLFLNYVKLHMVILPQFPEDVLVGNLMGRYDETKAGATATPEAKLQEIQKILTKYDNVAKLMIEYYKSRGILKSFYSNNIKGMWHKIEYAIEKYREQQKLKERSV